MKTQLLSQRLVLLFIHILALGVSFSLFTSCQKKTGLTVAEVRAGGRGATESDKDIDYEVRGSIADEEPVEFVNSISAVEISGVKLATSVQYKITAFYLNPEGKKIIIHEGISDNNRFNFKAKVPRRMIIIDAVSTVDGGKFAGVLPPPIRKLTANLRVNRTSAIAAKMAVIISDKASSGDAAAQSALSINSISVADLMTLAQSVRLAIDEQKKQKVGDSMNLSNLALKLLEKSNQRVAALANEGQKPEVIAAKLSESTYTTVFGEKAEEVSPAILAYRTNHDLGSSAAASEDVAYETIKSLEYSWVKLIDEAFRLEADAYRKALSLLIAVGSEYMISDIYASRFTACINGDASCAPPGYEPPPPPSFPIDSRPLPKVTVTGVSPRSGPTSGGTVVTITGSGFVAGAAVLIDDNKLTDVNVVSSASIVATTPPGSSGLKAVVVSSPNGQTGSLTKGFTYEDPPADLCQSVTPLQLSCPAATLNASLPRANPQPRRFWRVVNNHPLCAGWCINELEFHSSTTNESLLTNPATINQQVVRSSDFSNTSWPFKFAFDGINNSSSSNSGCSNQIEKQSGSVWVGWDFGVDKKVLVNRIRVSQIGYPYGQSWTVLSMKVQSSDDGMNWEDEWTVPCLTQENTMSDNSSNPTSWAESIRPGAL